MISRSEVSHGQVVSYLLGKLDPESHEDIKNIRNKEPLYNTLFKMIDEIKMETKMRQQRTLGDDPFMFSQIDQMLMDFFAGTNSKSQNQKIISALISSPRFYQRILIKLNQTSPKIVRDYNSDKEVISEAAAMKRFERIKLQSATTPGEAERLKYFSQLIEQGVLSFAILTMLSVAAAKVSQTHRRQRPLTRGHAKTISAIDMKLMNIGALLDVCSDASNPSFLNAWKEFEQRYGKIIIEAIVKYLIRLKIDRSGKVIKQVFSKVTKRLFANNFKLIKSFGKENGDRKVLAFLDGVCKKATNETIQKRKL